MNVKVNIDAKKILKKHGLGSDQRAAKQLATMIARHADKRVPFRKGPLKNTKQITANNGGVQLVYPQPYAHYQWEGKVMGPNYTDGKGKFWSGAAPKHYTGAAIDYAGKPTRGDHWIDRTWQEDGGKITSDFAKVVGGKKK